MRVTLLALFLAVASLLQGCFPLAATGVGATAVMLSDRRTAGTYIEDENIEWKVLGQMLQNFKDAHVNVTSYNHAVLLTGEAPTEKMKKDIEYAVRNTRGVVSVHNELVIGGNSSLTARSNDSLITTNVKARLVNNGKVSPTHIKVVTEANGVFLMGIVTRDEGDAAAEIARTSSGVSRVVKVFEYIAEAPRS
jgi:osmotically-inducible protein OsmY